MGYGRPINKLESDLIIFSYLEGSSTLKLGRLLGRRSSTIRNHLILKGIKLRSCNERKYQLNDYYFDDLSLEGSAYWLGALTADGHISGNRVVLDTKWDDVGWLGQFKNAIEYTGRIYKFSSPKNRFSSKPRATLSFTSRYMQDKLRNYGFSTNKTWDSHFCNHIPNCTIRHYIRGLIDGDGSICRTKQSDNYMVSFVGTRDLVSGVVDHLNSALGLNIKVRPHKMIYCFAVGGVDKPKKIVRYLYHDSNYYLQRKKVLAEECLQRVSKKRSKYSE